MSARYAGLKPFLFPDVLRGMREGTPAAPVHVQLILSDLCNQNCHFCCFRDESSPELRGMFAEGENHNPNRMLSFEKVLEILDDCAEMGVKGIELTGGGEPTIHKHFAEVVEAINARGLKWGLITNGVRMQDLSTAQWVRVSLDAATPETYSAVRQVEPQHFDRALETIRRWKTNVSFVVTRQNHAEIYRAAVLAKSLGAQSFRVRPQDDRGITLFNGLIASIIPQGRIVQDLAGPGFDVDYRFDTEFESMQQGGQDYDHCAYQHFKTWIGADQNLYRCCIYAYSPRGLIASIKGRRFKDVWREESVRNFREFNARACHQCRYAATNRAVNEVAAYDPSEAFV
ncbi:MAG: radical SAM protein [Sulfuricaulis sp.]|nr:radical SAM protein [Sulfuricaulis sp.]